MRVSQSAIKEFKVRVFQEDDGSYAAACSSLGVYTVGKTLEEVKKNFEEALDLHLSYRRLDVLMNFT